MARVTQQRQAARDDPEHDLEDEKRRVGRDGGDKPFRGLEVLGVIMRQDPYLPGDFIFYTHPLFASWLTTGVTRPVL